MRIHTTQPSKASSGKQSKPKKGSTANKPNTPGAPAPNKPEAGKTNAPSTPAPSKPENGNNPSKPSTPAPNKPEAGKTNTPSIPAPGKPDNVQPNMPGNDILSKQRQLKSELDKVLENLKAENQAQLEAALKKVTEDNYKQRQINYAHVSKNFDKNTPEGKMALEMLKKEYLAAAKLKLTRDKALAFQQHSDILNAEVRKLEEQVEKTISNM